MNDRYTKKVKLSAVEISEISMCLREAVKRAQKEGYEGSKEYVEKIQKLQKKFQRWAVKTEKEVMQDIRKMNNDIE